MPRSLHSGSVIPRGLIVDHVEAGPGLTITARPVAASARCPNGLVASRAVGRIRGRMSPVFRFC
jgi:hypothetical protein